MVVTLVATASVAMIYVGQPRKAVAEEESTATDEDANSDKDSPSHQTDRSNDATSDRVEVSGTVLGPDGKPVPGARVMTMRWIWAHHEPKLPFSETLTDQQGRFTISFLKSQIDRDIGQQKQWRNTSIIATKPGLGPDAVTWRELTDKKNATLRLVPDDVPIEGQVVDLEGNPVPDVQVTVGAIAKSKEGGDLTHWIEAIKNGEETYLAYRNLGGSLPEFEGMGGATTNAEGRFRLTGIGRERVALLVLQGATIARYQRPSDDAPSRAHHSHFRLCLAPKRNDLWREVSAGGIANTGDSRRRT